jgi:hypothetical protein
VEGDGPPPKRVLRNWNGERAKFSVLEDYWGPSPRFRDHEFERVFRITRARADDLLNALGNASEFF